MATRLQTTDFWDLRKGVFFDRTLAEIEIGGASDCLNVVNLYGKLRLRPGFSEVFPTLSTAPVYHVDSYVDFDGTRTLLRATRSILGDVEVFEWNGASWVSRGTFPGASLTGRICASSVNFKGEWFFCTGNEGPLLSWDGATLTDVRAAQTVDGLKVPESPRIVVAHPDRLIIADMKNSTGQRIRYRVAWSAQLDANVWRNDLSGDVGSGSAGFVDLADETDPINALYASGDIILALRARSIYQGDYIGTSLVYKFRQISEGAGCVAPGTLQVYRDDFLIWLGDDNVYVGGPNRRPQPVGSPIEPYIRKFVDFTRIECATATIDRDFHLYHLFLPSQATGNYDIMLTFSLQTGSWWIGVISATANISAVATHDFQPFFWNSENIIGSENGKLYCCDFNFLTDDGQNFPAFWESGLLAVDRFIRGTEQATIQEMRAYAESGSIGLSLKFGNGFDRFDTREFGTQLFDGTSSINRTERPKKAEHAKARLTWNDTFRNTQICGYSVGVIAEGKSRGRKG